MLLLCNSLHQVLAQVAGKIAKPGVFGRGEGGEGKQSSDVGLFCFVFSSFRTLFFSKLLVFVGLQFGVMDEM